MGPFALPPGVVTWTAPLVVPAPTVAISVLPLKWNSDAAVALNATALTPTRFLPEKVTGWPIGPWDGLILVICGGRIVNVPPVVLSPPAFVTTTTPVVAVGGTTALIWVVPFTVKLDAFVPLNLTAVVPPKLVPLSVTFVPPTPPVGDMIVMTGMWR